MLLYAFKRIEMRLKSAARNMLGSDADADDVLQDAFVRLWDRRYTIDDVSQAEALLTTTVKNIGIDTLRRRTKVQSSEFDGNVVEMCDDKEETEDREHIFCEIEEIIENELSPVAREILHRREYNDEGFETIAEALNMQPTAVRMQLSRARKIIRTCYLKSHGKD